MAGPTRYTYLSDEEFLLNMDEYVQYSPVLHEFARRLQKLIDSSVIPSDANHRASCPVCLAGLIVDYDEGNTLFNLKIEK